MSDTVHLVDDRHWSGWCEAKTGRGTTERADVTCQECLSLASPT